VLVCGGRFHDFEFARRELLSGLSRWDRLRTSVYQDFEFARPGGPLEAADLLVTYTCDVRPDDAEQAALEAFVAAGGRWLALHATNSAFDPPPSLPGRFTTPRVFPVMAEVLGSQFLGHPPIQPYTVEVTSPDHPLVAGVSAFDVEDELYCSELHGPLEVLLHTRFTGTCPGFEESEWPDDDPRPVLYVKRTGDGSVCYFTLGHCRGPVDMQEFMPEYPKVERGSWEVPAYRTVLGRCLEWAVTGSVDGA